MTDIINNLDTDIEVTSFAEEIKTDHEVENPFFVKREVNINNNYKNINDFTNKNIYYKYNRIFILCLNNNNIINNDFYKEKISIDDLKKYKNKLTLIQGNMKMINTVIHRKFINIIDSSYLDIFNHKKYDLDEEVLTVLMLNIEIDDVKLYLTQYNGYKDIKDVFKLKTINDYYSENKGKYYLTKIISNISETDYWKRYYNCKLNLSLKFMKRGFTYYETIIDKNIKEILARIYEEPPEKDKYLSFLFNKKKWVDVSDAIKKNGYSLYKITKPQYNITNKHFNNYIENVKSVREFYNITTSILLSKDYCHLVLNNRFVLDKLSSVDYYTNLLKKETNKDINPEKSLLERFILIYKYVISYSWIYMITEESITKTYIKEDARFIFDINVASKLFNFPYNINYPKSSPYLPLLISDRLLNTDNNLLCFGYTQNNNININNSSNIVDLCTFKNRLKIFLTGNANIDLLENVDWSNIFLCGSMSTAIIPKFNPLMYLFSKYPKNISNEEYNNFLDEYYQNSDCDVMCNEQNTYKYIDNAYDFYNTINNNASKIYKDKLIKELNLIKISSTKTAAIIINEEFIKKYILKNTNFSSEEIHNKLDENDIKKLFYNNYISYKLKENEEDIKNNYDKWINPKYSIKYDIVSIDNLTIIFGRTKLDWGNLKNINKKEKNINKKNINEKNINDEDIEYDNIDEIDDDDINIYDTNDNILFVVHENIKYKIYGEKSILKRHFEFFKVRYKSHLAAISRFHLPCVRAGYNGKTVLLLPSAISAYQTFLNMYYKYFAGKKSPPTIIMKNRMRGFGTILNDKEKIQTIRLLKAIPNYKDKIDITVHDKESVKSFFGIRNLNDIFFRNKDKNYNNISKNMSSFIDDNYKLIKEYEKYSSTCQKVVDFNNLYCINSYGYINPFEGWRIEAGFQVFF
jgi:hypothetical protein